MYEEKDLIDFSDPEQNPIESRSQEFKLQKPVESNSSPPVTTLTTSSNNSSTIIRRNNNNDEIKNKLFMKIDIDKIIIRNKENKTYTISCYSRTDTISLLVKYQRKELSLCLFGYKNEIRIPFDQLKGIKYDEGIFEIVMNHGFRRTYYEHIDTFPYTRRPMVSSEDPTRGIITNAVEFQMFPKNTEHPNTLVILEAGLNRICFKDDNEFSKDTNLIQGINNNSLPQIKFGDGEIYLLCIFNKTRHVLPFPRNGSINDFLSLVREKFNFSPSWIEYHDPMVGEKISVTIERDWDLAKSINSRSKKPQQNSFIEIYLS
ncbi:hypothetical protein Glove_326g51 [Diversispora epigaea]|uniref:PB1 domain-containing protein n=1 Tax=Diversispora epigaea TaxID=1348612 RepID=A0A397HLU7_9GLOM|nr:hypothetical protein Glove_326g51 [Diversispora epigaea]